MRYYIYSNNKPIEVSEPVYQEWEITDKYNYNFEDYGIVISNSSYLIRVTYLGVFGDFETPKPFVLTHSKNTKVNGKVQEESFIEFYETYEAVNFRRKQLLRQIKNKFLPFLN